MQTYANESIRHYRWLPLTLLGAADVGALATLRPDAAAACRQLPRLGAWVSRAGADKVVAQLAGAAGYAAAIWLGVGLVVALAAGLPGLPGRAAAHLCRAVLPKACRALAAGTAGVGVLAAPAAALAASSTDAAAPVAAAGAAGHTPGLPLPAPVWPTGSAPARHRPAQPIPAEHIRRAGAPQTSGSVRVRRGDCLWVLAARHLANHSTDAEIAAYWPRWYAANRAVIGPNPNLLQPGQVLRVPVPPRSPAAQQKS